MLSGYTVIFFSLTHIDTLPLKKCQIPINLKGWLFEVQEVPASSSISCSGFPQFCVFLWGSKLLFNMDPNRRSHNRLYGGHYTRPQRLYAQQQNEFSSINIVSPVIQTYLNSCWEENWINSQQYRCVKWYDVHSTCWDRVVEPQITSSAKQGNYISKIDSW